jgi:heme/copper-type cytochrome/quinol oxidase subunit 2
MGFGWSFYGFFIAAVVWLLLYFAWAFRAAARDRQRSRR